MVSRAVMLWNYIQAVFVSNLGSDTCYHEWDVLWGSGKCMDSTSFRLHSKSNSCIIQPFNAVLLADLRVPKHSRTVFLFLPLMCGVMFQPTRDATGAAIAVFTARLHYPQVSSHQTTLQVMFCACTIRGY